MTDDFKIPESSENPLGQYFRLPGITVTLPTGGRFLPKGAIELDATGRLGIYALSGADEALLKSPDALMSGLAIEKMIESCAPGIKTPKLISVPDLDVIFIGIRAASTGNTMPMEIKCPKCKEDNEFEIDLARVLETVTPVPEVLEVRLSPEVVATLQPHTLDSQTKILIAAYEESRRAQQIDDSYTEDQKKEILSQTVERVRQFQYDSIANAIAYVTTPDATVVDRGHIAEFARNAPRPWQDALQKKIEEINRMGIDRLVEVTCTNEKCKHTWQALLEFNPATFFDLGSSV